MNLGLFDLTGKVVLSTGANSGIGLAFLQGCAKHGADVVVWGRRADKNAEAVEELRSLGAPRAHAEAVDVSDEAAVETAFASTLEAMGRVDCVFANAGYQNAIPVDIDQFQAAGIFFQGRVNFAFYAFFNQFYLL